MCFLSLSYSCLWLDLIYFLSSYCVSLGFLFWFLLFFVTTHQFFWCEWTMNNYSKEIWIILPFFSQQQGILKFLGFWRFNGNFLLMIAPHSSDKFIISLFGKFIFFVKSSLKKIHKLDFVEAPPKMVYFLQSIKECYKFLKLSLFHILLLYREWDNSFEDTGFFFTFSLFPPNLTTLFSNISSYSTMINIC